MTTGVEDGSRNEGGLSQLGLEGQPKCPVLLKPSVTRLWLPCHTATMQLLMARAGCRDRTTKCWCLWLPPSLGCGSQHTVVVQARGTGNLVLLTQKCPAQGGWGQQERQPCDEEEPEQTLLCFCDGDA